MARANITYEPDFDGIAELLNSAQMEQTMRSAAEKGASHARSISPRRSGEYARSWRVDSMRNGGPKGDRAQGLIYNDAYHWWTVEYVNGHRVMARVVDYVERNGP
jgi:hypothetical protein